MESDPALNAHLRPHYSGAVFAPPGQSPICGGFGIGSGAGIGAGLGGAGSGGSGTGPGPGGTGLGGAGEGGGGTGSGLGIGEGEGAGMVAVEPVTKVAEQSFMFIWLVARPEVTFIPGRGSDRRRWPDVFGGYSNWRRNATNSAWSADKEALSASISASNAASRSELRSVSMVAPCPTGGGERKGGDGSASDAW
jgi:hypothetical protein